MRIENTTVEPLTRLPHIDYFKQKAGRIIQNEMKNPAIISLDISNFKYFNQMYGYEAGDRLIERCVYRYCHMNTDCVLACRIYVDHIIILAEAGRMDVEALCNKYDTMNRKFSNEINQEFPRARIRVYMGVFMIEDAYADEDMNDMIDKAQYARRSIKTNYACTVAAYTESMKNRVKNEAGVIPMFYSALENDRIKVFIQPKFAIDGHKLIGGEALSRIADDNGNIMPPNTYIDILERSGLITRLDNYVIQKIIELQKKWMEQGYELSTISMNLSRMDFWEPGFIQKIDEQIRKSGVPAKFFEFELTETIFCENLSHIIEQIEFLKGHGYKISMDDFGSGYNSLYLLGTVPVDVIKFDRGFVTNSLKVEAGRSILKNLLNTFKNINFDVICEGIESEEEEKIVYECGCNAVQGFLYDRPLPYEIYEQKYVLR